MTLFLLCTGCVGREFIDGVDGCCTCHSVFIDHFKVYSYSLFAGNLWISRDIVFFSFPCVGHDSIFAIYLMLTSWIHWRCQFYVVPVTQYSLTIQGLRSLCFGRRFMDQPWHSIFDNSMRRPWLYFLYRFDASVVSSLTLSIPCDSCHSVFIDDFKVYCYSLVAGDSWISRDRVFFSFPCVGHDSIFAIYLMLPSWIHARCRFHDVPVTQYSLMISRSTVTSFCRRFMDQPSQSVFFFSMRRPWLYFCYLLDASVVNSLTLSIPWCTCHSVFIDDFKVYSYSVFAVDLWISRDIAFLTIPCVGHDSIFSIDLMRR